MRWSLLLLSLALLGGHGNATAQPSATTRQQAVARNAAAAADTIQAATAKAVSNLYEQIAPLPLTSRETVGQYVRNNRLEERFVDTLRRADQIGGPRWLDEYTCQVRLEIPVARVTYALKQFAAANPRSSPAPAQIDRIAATWPKQVIGATGSSVASTQLADIRPRSGAWAAVDEKVRQGALQEARLAAVRRSMDSVAAVRLGGGQTLREAFADPEVERPVREWLESRPVTEVDFDEHRAGPRQKLEVAVTLGVDEADYFDQVRNALEARKGESLPKDDEAWERVRRDFASMFRTPMGRAAIQVQDAASEAKQFLLPPRAPDWVNDEVRVQGLAKYSGASAVAKLKARQQAEADARTKVRERVEALPLDGDRTVGQAAAKDRRVEAALRRAMERVSAPKHDYRGDGTVTVDLILDLRNVWDELRR